MGLVHLNSHIMKKGKKDEKPRKKDPKTAIKVVIIFVPGIYTCTYQEQKLLPGGNVALRYTF